jgi:hypothetical protein
LSLLALCACAEGSAIDTSIGEDDGSGVGGDGFGGDGGGHDSTSSSISSASTGASTGGAGGDSTGAGGMGGGAGGADPGCDFTAPNTCQSAEPLASVDGDDGGTSSAQGVGSKWFVIKIVENNSDISEVDMSYTVTLSSPPGMQYHLVVHQGPQDGSPDCNAAPKNGTGTNPQTVSDSWDDDQGLGGEDDSLYLSISVQHVSGNDCDAEWTLLVEGGT